MTETTRDTYDKEAIRERLKFHEVLQKEFGVELRRAGSGLECRCPFHDERTPSFSIRDGIEGDFGYCFGCSWSGDIFKLWMESRGCSFPDAVKALAGMCGVYPQIESVGWKNRNTKPISEELKVKEKPLRKPDLPPMRKMTKAEVGQLADMRGLSRSGVRIAADTFRRVGVCQWPQWRSKRTGIWQVAEDAALSWVITDDSRWCAQFRRFDGEKYELKRKEGTREIKAWTQGSPKWPIGASEIGDRRGVLMVEGGADLLAAYHFLHCHGQLKRVAVVAMLGASNKIVEDALPHFEGKRVRIMMDVDEPKQVGQKMKIPSWEAATRWQRQLTESGAAVESFSLADLVTASGEPVKDLNDLALCNGDVLDDPGIREAFFQWDF